MVVPSVGDPAEHLVDFLVHVMPGFIALQLFRAKYPAKQLSEFLQVAWSLIYGVILAAVVHAIDGRFLHGRLGTSLARFKIAVHWPRFEGIAPDPQSIWVKVNRPSNDYAVVYVDDGSVYLGWIKDYTFDPDAEDNDFLLVDAKRVDEQLRELYSVTGRGVYLNTRNVKRIEFV
jgi:hypothetical protein